MKKTFFFTIIIVLLLNSVAFTQCYQANIDEGIKMYNAGKYTDAKVLFQRSLNCPDYEIRNEGAEARKWIKKCDEKIFAVSVGQVTIHTIKHNSATVTANVSGRVTERGIVYSTSRNPTSSNSKVAAGSGTGSFSVSLTGLSGNKTYYVRAYAINENGTTYGEEKSFGCFINSNDTIYYGADNKFVDNKYAASYFLVYNPDAISKRYYINGTIEFQGYIMYLDKNDWCLCRFMGKCIWYYENGNICTEGHWSIDGFEGLVKKYYPNGKLSNEQNFSKGQRNGTLTQYYENGNKQNRCNFLGDQISTGYYTFWHENGNIKLKSYYENGELNGFTIEYYENGTVKNNGTMMNGYFSGNLIAYYENGKKMFEGILKNGKADGYGCIYNQNGEKVCGNWQDGNYRGGNFEIGKYSLLTPKSETFPSGFCFF